MGWLPEMTPDLPSPAKRPEVAAVPPPPDPPVEFDHAREGPAHRASGAGAAMNLAFPSQRVETLLDVYGTYHLARLQSCRDLRDLAPGFAEAQLDLGDVADHYRRAQIEAMRLLGLMDTQVGILLDGLRARAEVEAAEASAGGDRPLAPDRAPEMRGPLPLALIEEALATADGHRRAAEHESDPVILRRAADLSIAAEGARAALLACETAQRRAEEAYASLQRARARWLRAYRESYREAQRRRRCGFQPRAH